MDYSLADFALRQAQRLGASYAEVRLNHVASSGFTMKNGVLQESGFDQVTGLGIRFLARNHLGFLALNDPDKEKLKAHLPRALRMARAIGTHGEEAHLARERIHKADYKVAQKKNILDVDPAEKLRLLLDIEKELKRGKAKVSARIMGLADDLTKEYLATSEGTRITSSIPRLHFFYYLTIKEKQKSAQRYWNYGASGGWEFADAWHLPEILADEARAMQQNLRHGTKPPRGKVDVVVGPQVTGIIVHESCGHPLEADRILGREAAQAGESFVTQTMLGQVMGSKEVTIVDDPTIPNSYGFYRFDSEGVLARRKTLLKKGQIEEFLHNRQTAASLSLQSNGSARAASHDRESIVRMSNTFMLPGSYSEEELFEGITLGVYMKNFMEWNIDDKRLNQKYVGAECYLIKKGRLAGPLVQPVIEMNTPHLYSSIDAVGKNLELHAGSCGKGEPMQAIPVDLGGPSIRIRGVRVR